MRRNNFGYYAYEGIQGIFQHGFMSFASVSIIVACLVIIGSFSLLIININALIKNLEEKNEVIAYIDENLTEKEAKGLESRLLMISNIDSAKFVTREEARESFLKQYKDTTLFDSLDEKVFRHRFIIYLKDITFMADTKEQIEAVNGIAKVNAHLEISEGFVSIRNILGVISVLIIAVLLIVSLFIISNTIKLATFDRREEIAIMKMVGATNNFIRWPFVFQGFILGILGALMAFFIEWGIYKILIAKIAETDTMQLFSMLPFDDVSTSMIGIFLVTGFFIGVGGSLFTIRKYLRV